MSAEVLREAARLMRDRADHATEGPWEAQSFADGSTFVERVGLDDDDDGREVGCLNRPLDAEHVASWHPDVALAAAGLLDAFAYRLGGLRTRGCLADQPHRPFRPRLPRGALMSALTLTALLVLIGTPCLAWALTALWLWLDPVETRALDWPEVERWEERGWDDNARAAFYTEPEWCSPGDGDAA